MYKGEGQEAVVKAGEEAKFLISLHFMSCSLRALGGELKLTGVRVKSAGKCKESLLR